MRRLLIVLFGAFAAIGLLGAPAAAQDDAPAPGGVPPVDVLQVDGLFDDILVDEISTAIDRAVENGSQALILQVNSRGAVVPDERIAELMHEITDAPIAVAIWVGPSGARLYGAPAQLLAVADVSGMPPGSEIGRVGDPVSDIPLGPGLIALRDDVAGLTQARSLDVFRQRISDEGIAAVTNMIDALDGYEKNGFVIETSTESVTESGVVQRELVSTPRFFKLGLLEQLFHTVASPAVAYLMLLLGLGLLVFEFFTAGVGIAGVVGAAATVLAGYGLGALPTRWWAAALIALAMLAFAVDVQVGIPRFWTAVGVVLTIVGSVWLFAPVAGSSLRVPWISLLAGIAGVIFAFVSGMPSMTRTRFATATIDRDWMIGAEGVAVGPADPDGTARVGGGEWPARAATPLPDGTPIRVAAVDGAVLEVEPLDPT